MNPKEVTHEMKQETKAPQVPNVVSPPPVGGMEIPKPPTQDQIDKAWLYYQQADNLQHQRHAVFIVAQSIFFAAFTQAPTLLRYTVAAVGALLCVLWWYITERVSDGMTELNNNYLAKDDVYPTYLIGLERRKTTSGRFILNKALPWVTFVAWGVLVALVSMGKLPAPH
jgi:hypothetical protein